VHVVRSVVASGQRAGDDVWIRTLGGVVGNVGQQVDGEAVLRVGQTSLLFLSAHAQSVVVTARGQGQFAIVPTPGGASFVRRNFIAGALLPPNPINVARIQALTTASHAAMPAADVLDGHSVEDAAVEISASWSRTHGP
jgi:hypothetical protein